MKVFALAIEAVGSLRLLYREFVQAHVDTIFSLVRPGKCGVHDLLPGMAMGVEGLDVVVGLPGGVHVGYRKNLNFKRVSLSVFLNSCPFSRATESNAKFFLAVAAGVGLNTGSNPLYDVDYVRSAKVPAAPFPSRDVSPLGINGDRLTDRVFMARHVVGNVQ